jgi:hypothetical protein
MSRFAVNVFDISTIPIFGLCFGQHCQGRQIVNPKGQRNIDESGIVLECPDSQALAIIETLRIKARVRVYEYSFTSKAWKRMKEAK